MKAPVRVAVTGAAGQIGYSLIYRIASGEMLGKDQPVILQMLELPMDKAQAALKGCMMELEDCAFPLLAGMVGTADPKEAFKDIDYAWRTRRSSSSRDVRSTLPRSAARRSSWSATPRTRTRTSR